MSSQDDEKNRLSRREKALVVSGLVLAGTVAVLLLRLRGSAPAAPEVAPPAQASRADAGAEPPGEQDVPPGRAGAPLPRLDQAASTQPALEPTPEAASGNPFEGPGATEALRAHRLAELERKWSQVAIARERNHEGDLLKVSSLILAGMKPILDEAGFGELQVGTRTEYPPDTHHLFINGLDYFVPHGQFPVVDRYYQLWRDWSARSEAARAGDPFAVVPFVLDEPFLISLEAMKDQAAAALATRAELY